MLRLISFAVQRSGNGVLAGREMERLAAVWIGREGAARVAI